MDYSNFLIMNHEISLVVVLILTLFADLFIGNNKKAFQYIVLGLFAIHTVLGFTQWGSLDEAESFGGMYITSNIHCFVKNFLNIGTLLVFLFGFEWNKQDNQKYCGEFYFITLATLFGMYLMISSGDFLLFYIGLETASIPMATLVAFNKKENESAEVRFVELKSTVVTQRQSIKISKNGIQVEIPENSMPALLKEVISTLASL